MVEKSDSEEARSARAVDTIAGIGPTRRRWLTSALGVRTTGELARVDPDALARLLAQAGDIQGARRAHQWVAAAQRSIEEAAAPPAIEEAEPDDVDGIALEPPGARSPVAAFVVEVERRGDALVTAVHHMEGDRTRYWHGLMPSAACAWISSRTREALEGSLD